MNLNEFKLHTKVFLPKTTKLFNNSSFGAKPVDQIGYNSLLKMLLFKIFFKQTQIFVRC